jgi:hypothetical protein
MMGLDNKTYRLSERQLSSLRIRGWVFWGDLLGWWQGCQIGAFDRLVKEGHLETPRQPAKGMAYRKICTNIYFFDELCAWSIQISKHSFRNTSVHGYILSVQCRTSCGYQYNEGTINM